MKNSSNILIVNIMSFAVVFLMSSCSKEKIETAEEAESKRMAVSAAMDLARQLHKANPVHDAQYYLDKQAEIITICGKQSDMNNCLKERLEALAR